MAYEGELVKMADGRWARFRRCQVLGPLPDAPTVLVAVELEERYQRMLAAAEGSLETYRARGIPVRVHLDADPEGHEQVRIAENLAAV